MKRQYIFVCVCVQQYIFDHETNRKQQIINISLQKNNKHFPKLDTNSFKAQIPIIFSSSFVNFFLQKKNINIGELCVDSKKDVVIVCLLLINMSKAKMLWQTIESSTYEKCSPYYDDLFMCSLSLIFLLHFALNHSIFNRTMTVWKLCHSHRCSASCGIVIGFSFEIFKLKNNKWRRKKFY